MIAERNLTKSERLLLALFEIHEKDYEGLTRHNLREFTGYSRTTVSAALLGLKAEGFIEVVSTRRTTKNSGRPAWVYRLTEKARKRHDEL